MKTFKEQEEHLYKQFIQACLDKNLVKARWDVILLANLYDSRYENLLDAINKKTNCLEVLAIRRAVKKAIKVLKKGESNEFTENSRK